MLKEAAALLYLCIVLVHISLQTMLLNVLLVACAAMLADCQHLPKLTRLPSISNSLVNLGKMDISFHINSNAGGKSGELAGILMFVTINNHFCADCIRMIAAVLQKTTTNAYLFIII